MKDEDTATDGDDQDSGDDADAKDTGTDDDTDKTSADDDTSDGDDADDKTGDNSDDDSKDDSDDDTEPPMIPKHRLDEEISKKKKLEGDKEDLQEQLDALTQIQNSKQGDDTKAKKNEVVKSLKDQGYDKEQIDAIIAIAQEYGGGADATKQVEDLRTELAQEKDRNELDKTVKDFAGDGIEVSEDNIKAQMKEWRKDSDPRVQLQADLPYPVIVQLMKGKEINEKEVNASLSKKTKTSTHVDGGKKTSEKTPSEKKLEYAPGDPVAFSEALEQEVFRRLEAEE